jgi:hypothetical protein
LLLDKVSLVVLNIVGFWSRISDYFHIEVQFVLTYLFIIKILAALVAVGSEQNELFSCVV